MALTVLEDGSLDVARIKKDFPILEVLVHGQRLVFLDSAASSQKPSAVIDSMTEYYETTHANVHRGCTPWPRKPPDATKKPEPKWPGSSAPARPRRSSSPRT